MIVAALVRDPISKARLSDALRNEASIRYCERLTEVVALVEAGLANLVVADHRDYNGSATLPAVRRLRNDYPSVPVVMYLPMAAVASGAVMDYARAGVSQLLFQGMDDFKASLRSAVNAALDQVSATSLSAEFEALIPQLSSRFSGTAWSMLGATSPSRKSPPQWECIERRSSTG